MNPIEQRVEGMVRLIEAESQGENRVFVCDQHPWFVGRSPESAKLHNSLYKSSCDVQDWPLLHIKLVIEK